MRSSPIKKMIIIGSSVLFPSMALATYSSYQANDPNLTPRIENNGYVARPGNWMLTLGSGIGFITNSQNTLITNTTGFPPPYGQDIYTTNSGSTTSTLFILAGGYQWKRMSDWLPYTTTELKYTHFTNVSLGGQVLKLSIPSANNYIYNYDLEEQTALFNLKTDLTTWHHLMPYLSLGAGIAINQMQNYTEYNQPTIAVRTSPSFGNNTSINFAYQIGAGLDYLIKNELILSAGYAYQNLGDVTTASGTGPTYTGQSLAQTAKAQLLEITVTYLFKN